MKLVQNAPEKLIMIMDANESLANALRRSINEIEVLAFDDVEIFKNDSALYDEFLAHRIGLVPLVAEKSASRKTALQMKLTKKGPGLVYSGDFKGGVKLVHDKIPLTLLENGQEIEIVATAKLGKGIEHDKHSPGLAYYRFLSEVNSKNPKVEELVRNSSGVISPEKKGSTWKCDLSDALADEIECIDSEAIKDSNEMIFVVESWGQLSAKDILVKSIEALEKNLKEFDKALK